MSGTDWWAVTPAARAERNAKIWEAHNAGISFQKIADLLGLTPAQVGNVVERRRHQEVMAAVARDCATLGWPEGTKPALRRVSAHVTRGHVWTPESQWAEIAAERR